MEFARKHIKICGEDTIFHGFEWDPFFTSLSDHWDGNRSLQVYLSEHVDDNAVILDVGANIGTTAIMMSRTVPGARIIAIEPTPGGFACLQQNITVNGIPRSTLIQAAAGDVPGVAMFHQSNYIAGSHIVTSDHPTIRDENGSIKVQVMTIDQIVEQQGLERVDFIKIDVEGFEPAVIRGAAKTIARFSPAVFVEFNAFTLAAYGDGNPRAFLNEVRRIFPAIAYDRIGERVLIRSDMDALGFLNYNMTQAGCVSDLICADSRDRVVKSRIRNEAPRVRDSDEVAVGIADLAAERDAQRRRAEEFENSLSWRVTEPLRKLSKALGYRRS